jgi:hypothetical protein
MINELLSEIIAIQSFSKQNLYQFQTVLDDNLVDLIAADPVLAASKTNDPLWNQAQQDDTAAMAQQFEAKINNHWTEAQGLDTDVRASTVKGLYAEYKRLSDQQTIKASRTQVHSLVAGYSTQEGQI